jgi:hypothetical protein
VFPTTLVHCRAVAWAFHHIVKQVSEVRCTKVGMNHTAVAHSFVLVRLQTVKAATDEDVAGD